MTRRHSSLVVGDRTWYLIAWDHPSSEVRQFTLCNVKSAAKTGDFFDPPPGFSLEEFMEKGFGAQKSSGDEMKVRLRFSAKVTPLAQTRPWKRDQKASVDSQGRLVVEFRTSALHAVAQQVLFWKGDVEALEPAALREQVARAAREILRAHG